MKPVIMVSDINGKELPFEGQFIEKELLEKSGGKLVISTLIPIVDVVSIWHPELLTIAPVKLPWFSEYTCGATKSYPFFAFLNPMCHVSFAIGLTDHIDDCRASAKMNQELCGYEVKFEISIAPETEAFEVFFDDSKQSLNDVMQRYRKLVMPENPAYPAGAWEPVYCSWYAVHTAITDEYLQRNAEEAVKLGFGTFIVDDGWCFDENKRVTPLTLPDWYRDIGDWKWSEKKLPQLKEKVKAAQSMGLNYMFWTAPFFSGRRSELDKVVSKYLTELHEGQRIYDPVDETAVNATQESICEIYKSMDLDGLKIDFIDSVIPNPDDPHCRAARNYVEKLVARLREHKPEARIEFRQNYGTPVNAALATAFRAGDVPFDYVENFNRCLQLRLHLGDGIPVHADPVYFNPEESINTVGKHMIASLAGVPMLSMELSSIADEHKKVIANYMKFYREHQQTLNDGHWFIEFRSGFPTWVKCESDSESIVILTDEAFIDQVVATCNNSTYVLNMTPGGFKCACGQAFDAQGNPCGTTAPVGGRLELL